MRLLLDTHALLWWLDDDPRLSLGARSRIADEQDDVLVSVVSLWEIAVKARIGKLQADAGRIGRQLENEGFRLLDITLAHLDALGALPQHHRDPFDHLLIAQALVKGAALVTGDNKLRLYPVPSIAC